MIAIKKDYFYLAGFGVLLLVILFQKCSGEKALENVAAQISRYKDTTIIYREVEGKQVADTKAAGLTINEYRAADPNNSAAIERMLGRRDELISTLILELANERRRGEAPVLKDSAGEITVPFEDSCITLKTTIPVKGKAIIDYQFKTQSYSMGVAMRREKWFKDKQPVATGSIMSGCGKITNQKVVLISQDKKKVHQTNLFKAGVVIVVFEGLRFLITGKP